MLNINQNFDLKAPVFNFDRDYFNSVEELNAYDTSNVPNHFVTNVAGMLYQFTDGKWLPMMATRTSYNDNYYNVNFGSIHAGLQLEKGTDNNFYPSEFSLWSENEKSASFSPGHLSLRGKDDTNYFGIDATEMSAKLTDENGKAISASITDKGPQVSLTSGDYSIKLNAGTNGLTITTDDPFTTNADGETIDIISPYGIYARYGYFGMVLYDQDNSQHLQVGDIYVQGDTAIGVKLGRDDKSYIYRPLDESEGATITGIKSLTAFANPSATKVWATDGSTVDLTTKADASALATKANASDVLLKKSSSGGYYIEENSNELGLKAFAANSYCTASGSSSFAEGCGTKALGHSAHAEGYYTTANGTSTHAEGESTQATQPGAHAEGYYTLAKTVGSHTEGYYTVSNGLYSHAEGNYTETAGFAEHAQGTYNVVNKNAIHSVGIGNSATRKNAEYIYAKSTEGGGNLVDDPKNGYKYLIGVGGYDGISTDNSTYKSVQEVIADLTTRIEQLETKVRALEAANTPA